MSSIVIPVDGFARRGKSTAAELIAQRNGWEVGNSGDLFRLATFIVLLRNIDITDGSACIEAMLRAQIAMSLDMNKVPRNRVLLGGRDITNDLYTPAIDDNVSIVASHRSLREVFVTQLYPRIFATAGNGIVFTGRDIFHVLRDTMGIPLAFYIDANVETAAGRQAQSPGENRSLAEIEEAIRSRDLRDATNTFRESGAVYILNEAPCIEHTVSVMQAWINEMVHGDQDPERAQANADQYCTEHSLPRLSWVVQDIPVLV